MTNPLYYTDPMALEFETQLASLNEEGTQLVLTETLFYPEGGGQPADTGWIAGIPVVDVQKGDDGVIVHTLSEPLSIHDRSSTTTGDTEDGKTVTGRIDWDHRFEYMQQHTGQHVLSAALMAVAGAGTVSVAQGSEVTSIEIDTDTLDAPKIDAVVDRANEAIRENLPVTGFWIDDRQLASYRLRRPTKRTGKIRLVQIGDAPFDLVACGGVHLPRTGLLNLVEVVAEERIRGHQRLHFKIGKRALEHYRISHRTLAEAAELFSAQPTDVPERIGQEITAGQELRRTHRLQNERIAGYIVDAAERERTSFPGGGSFTYVELNEEDPEVFKAIAETAADRISATADTTPSRFLALNTIGDTLHWAFASGEDPFPGEALRAGVLNPLEAKGGGKPPLWRGIVPSATGETRERFVQGIKSLSDQ